MFDCDSCPVAEQLEGLDAMNCRVWALYRKVVTRLAADLYMGGVVLARLTQDLDADEFDDVWRRLLVLYDALQPVPNEQPPMET